MFGQKMLLPADLAQCSRTSMIGWLFSQRTNFGLRSMLDHLLLKGPIYQIVPRGLMARIPGFHPGGPGSIPGVGVHF